MRKGVVAAAVLALVGREARAQEKATSNAFDQACIDLFHGKTPRSAAETEALRDACSKMIKARQEERVQAEQRRKMQEEAQQQAAAAKAGKSTAQVQSGGNALAAFTQAGNELVGARQRGTMGLNRAGEPFRNTVTTNVVGWFTGQGVNADYTRSFMDIFSWTVGAHFSQTAATDTSLYTLGFDAGADWYIIGRNNEGLRIGPRLDYSFGREQSTGTQTRGRLGLTGEVGYNFLATNGITGLAAFGLGGRVSGDKNTELSSAAGGEFGPYVKLAIGYSW
jgi:hypothetical protein